jgi:hypothetical protein
MSFSAKLFELILYPESYDISKLDDILQHSRILYYAYIRHDKDDKKEHVHVDIKTKDSCKSDDVARWFGVNENVVGKAKSKGGDDLKWAHMLKYLTHENAPEKHQYEENLVTSNFQWKKAKEVVNNQARLNDIIQNIASGVIREYNYTKHISDVEYIKFSRQIEKAFNYRKDKLRGVERDMECIFITGDSATGKTSYAKLICEEKGYSYFVSSGSNDVLDGYMGEDVIILDDLRPSCLGLSDLLKMLDNNTASSVKSRYKNKILECRMIIVTTVLPIDTFFSNVFTEEKETIIQLKRRCKTYIHMFSDTMNIYLYDDILRDYDIPFSAKNPIANKYKAVKLNRKEKLEKMKKLLGNLEIEENDSKMELVKENIDIKAIFGK